jgi:acyl-CoA synthetase (AMP-forming)/AMP-acid ligase II
VSLHPDERLYTFLVDGEAEEVHLTYRELDRQAQAIAAVLQEKGSAGERALLLYPPGLEYIAAFFGCLYAGAIAVPVYPPDPSRLNRTLPRLQAIAKDAQATIALTTRSLLSMTDFVFEQAPDLKELQWIATDTLSPIAHHRSPITEIAPDSIAFLQYTSGATGNPKGVMLTHRNLIHNSEMICRSAGHHSRSVGIIWLPSYHDMGLIGGILQPVYRGFPTILMSPLHFLQRPLRWLQTVSRYRGTTSAGPNFAYDLCVRKITPEQRKGLDLSSWEVAFCGAEPIRTETLERFAECFAPCGFRREAFYPCYGLAEGTLIVSGGKKEDPPIIKTLDNGKNLVGCGRALRDQEIVIVDPEMMLRCASEQVGEIWVSGPSVAKGYWNRSEETRETFQAYLKDTGEGPFLRTGDLGLLRDGELFVTGRLKDLIIIRGRNYYPQDIEKTVEQCCPVVRPGCCAAFTAELDSEERLVVVSEVDRRQSFDVRRVIRDIRKSISEQYDLNLQTVLFLQAGTIPKTSSGKIRRSECRRQYLAGTLEALEAPK